MVLVSVIAILNGITLYFLTSYLRVYESSVSFMLILLPTLLLNLLIIFPCFCFVAAFVGFPR